MYELLLKVAKSESLSVQIDTNFFDGLFFCGIFGEDAERSEFPLLRFISFIKHVAFNQIKNHRKGK